MHWRRYHGLLARAGRTTGILCLQCVYVGVLCPVHVNMRMPCVCVCLVYVCYDVDISYLLIYYTFISHAYYSHSIRIPMHLPIYLPTYTPTMLTYTFTYTSTHQRLDPGPESARLARPVRGPAL